jgi:hypothetical protein
VTRRKNARATVSPRSELPKLTREHRIANEAVNAVSFLFAKAGAIGEQIRNDYGEDLFLLTNLNDHVDSFRIWVQVKGASLSKTSKGRYSHRFEIRHLIRLGVSDRSYDHLYL